MSDAWRVTPSRRIDSRSSTWSFLSAPPLPDDVRRPPSFCRTSPVPCGRRVAAQAVLLAYFRLDRGGDLGMLAQEVARILASLTDALAVESVPGARLLDDSLLGCDVDQLSLLGDADAVQDVELR